MHKLTLSPDRFLVVDAAGRRSVIDEGGREKLSHEDLLGWPVRLIFSVAGTHWMEKHKPAELAMFLDIRRNALDAFGIDGDGGSTFRTFGHGAVECVNVEPIQGLIEFLAASGAIELPVLSGEIEGHDNSCPVGMGGGDTPSLQRQ